MEMHICCEMNIINNMFNTVRSVSGKQGCTVAAVISPAAAARMNGSVSNNGDHLCRRVKPFM